MKKLLYLLLSCLLLCGCNTKSMVIKDAELNNSETKLLKLLAKYGHYHIFDFSVDSTVNEMVVTLYELGDEDWQIIKQSSMDVSNTTGRILVEDSDVREHCQIGYEIDDNYGLLITKDIGETTTLPGGGAIFSGEHKIVLNQELVLLNQVWTEKKEIDTLLIGSLSELYTFYSSRNYEEVYIVTVVFK